MSVTHFSLILSALKSLFKIFSSNSFSLTIVHPLVFRRIIDLRFIDLINLSTRLWLLNVVFTLQYHWNSAIVEFITTFMKLFSNNFWSLFIFHLASWFGCYFPFIISRTGWFHYFTKNHYRYWILIIFIKFFKFINCFKFKIYTYFIDLLWNSYNFFNMKFSASNLRILSLAYFNSSSVFSESVNSDLSRFSIFLPRLSFNPFSLLEKYFYPNCILVDKRHYIS